MSWESIIDQAIVDTTASSKNMTKTQKRRIEITIETRKQTIIRMTVPKNDLTGCQHCGGNVSTLNDMHAIALGLDEGQIAALTQLGTIHRVANGSLCGNSLAGYYTDQSEHSSITLNDT